MLTATKRPRRKAQQLPERRVRSEELAAYLGPQEDRDPLSHLDHLLLFYRGYLRRHDPARTGNSRRRPTRVRRLQQDVHHAWHHHGLLLPRPLDTGHARQLSDTADDRRQRSGVSQDQPAELVYLHRRRTLHVLCSAHRRRRYRLDLLHSVQHQLLEYQSDGRGGRYLHRRLLLDSHRPELHRHHSPDAGARHELVPACPCSSGPTTPPP